MTKSPIRYLTRLDVWALSLGCAVGWGAFVMPGTTLLPLAGPVGTLLAMVVATLVMLLIASCISYVGRRRSDIGGAFGFVRRAFGHDHAFLCAWSLGLAYIAIIWANATAVVLVFRYLFGPALQFGHLWRLAGYDVYVGEMLVTWGVIVGFGLLCLKCGRVVRVLNTASALVLFAGVLLCLVTVARASGGLGGSVLASAPAQSGRAALGVVDVIALAPWAFVGFESVSHSSEEFAFDTGRLLPVLAAAVACAFLIYASTTAMSLMAVPQGFSGWADYLAALPGLGGVEGLPVFYAVRSAGGSGGLALLCVTAASAVATSMMGLYRASARLLCAMAAEGILPQRLAARDAGGTPRQTILLVMLVSVLAPFVGRAAIGWIVDVTSVSASIAYLYVSAAALKLARAEERPHMAVAGVVGIVASVAFFVFPLVPNLWSLTALAPESYLILAAWAMLGLLIFAVVFRRDRQGRFGRSTVVWVALLFLVFFASTMWVRQATSAAAERVVTEMDEYHAQLHDEHGVPMTDEEAAQEDEFVSERTEELRETLLNSGLVQMALIAFCLAVMFGIYSQMSRRAVELEARRIAAEEAGRARTMFLSNVSHDLRTPMNAIVGYTKLARREDLDATEVRDYLEKIDDAGAYMMSLVNDVLDMGQMEGGHARLELGACDLPRLVSDVCDMVAGQMEDAGIDFAYDVSQVRHPRVLCDKNRMSSVVMNLLSNACKFTPEGGAASLTLTELYGAPEGSASFELRVSDTGIGMSEEFAERIFEPFERERDPRAGEIQGTGLGMAITKGSVDLMGGSISVSSTQGAGTEFLVELCLEVAAEDDRAAVPAPGGAEAPATGLAGRRVLLVDDNEINREIAQIVLEDMGIEVTTAENGLVAYEMVAGSSPGRFDAVLMDVRMPVMGGYEATRKIRELDDEALAKIPVVAVTANALAADEMDARAAGMDAHLAKPLDADEVAKTLEALLE